MNRHENSDVGARRQKGDVVKFRLSESEKDAFQQAAELAGIGLSAWMRERLRKSARSELEAANLPVPFIKTIMVD